MVSTHYLIHISIGNISITYTFLLVIQSLRLLKYSYEFCEGASLSLNLVLKAAEQSNALDAGF